MVATEHNDVLARVLEREKSRPRVFAAVLSALLAHGGLAALALQQHAPQPALVDVTEVDFMPAAVAPKPEPEPLPPEPEPEAKPVAPPREPVARPQARAPKAQPPASAAALHTVDEGVKTADEPVRFVTDPNGTAFGFGTVQRGGTARSATGPVAAAAAPVEPGSTAQAPSLSRPPKLGESDPCRGYFPEKARVDRGEVALRVRVERDGSVRSISVSSETPMGHGFGFAARDCLRAKRFTPALDLVGKEVAVVSPITVRFSR